MGTPQQQGGKAQAIYYLSEIENLGSCSEVMGICFWACVKMTSQGLPEPPRTSAGIGVGVIHVGKLPAPGFEDGGLERGGTWLGRLPFSPSSKTTLHDELSGDELSGEDRVQCHKSPSSKAFISRWGD